jgi:hypothetical protein
MIPCLLCVSADSLEWLELRRLLELSPFQVTTGPSFLSSDLQPKLVNPKNTDRSVRLESKIKIKMYIEWNGFSYPHSTLLSQIFRICSST